MGAVLKLYAERSRVDMDEAMSVSCDIPSSFMSHDAKDGACRVYT
jgi:hypothetical protein